MSLRKGIRLPAIPANETRVVISRLLCLLEPVINSMLETRITSIEMVERPALSRFYKFTIYGDGERIGSSVLEDIDLPNILDYTTVLPYSPDPNLHYLAWKVIGKHSSLVVDLYGIPLIPYNKITYDEAQDVLSAVQSLKAQGYIGTRNKLAQELGDILGLTVETKGVNAAGGEYSFRSVSIIQGDIKQGEDFISYAFKMLEEGKPIYKLEYKDGKLRKSIQQSQV